MDDDGIQQLHPYPQHPPKSVGDLAAKLIENGLGGVDRPTLECVCSIGSGPVAGARKIGNGFQIGIQSLHHLSWHCA